MTSFDRILRKLQCSCHHLGFHIYHEFSVEWNTDELLTNARIVGGRMNDYFQLFFVKAAGDIGNVNVLEQSQYQAITRVRVESPARNQCLVYCVSVPVFWVPVNSRRVRFKRPKIVRNADNDNNKNPVLSEFPLSLEQCFSNGSNFLINLT